MTFKALRKPRTDFFKFLTKILFDKLFTRVISVQPKRGPQSSCATSGSKIHTYMHTQSLANMKQTMSNI